MTEFPLKNGCRFLEAFLKYCMPILDLTLKKNKEEVHGVLKNLQQSTRSLHHFCGHSKVVQDMTLTGHVPLTKKFLETFVFRVKTMLAVNQCHSAFWLGNLKSRDVHGNEINSQASFNETEEECGTVPEHIDTTKHCIDLEPCYEEVLVGEIGDDGIGEGGATTEGQSQATPPHAIAPVTPISSSTPIVGQVAEVEADQVFIKEAKCPICMEGHGADNQDIIYRWSACKIDYHGIRLLLWTNNADTCPTCRAVGDQSCVFIEIIVFMPLISIQDMIDHILINRTIDDLSRFNNIAVVKLLNHDGGEVDFHVG
eukprot:gene12564-3260_t